MGSLQTLLMVIAGALALAGLTGSAIFRLGTRRRRAPNIDRARRRVVWEAADGARQSQSQPRQSPSRRQSAPSLSPAQTNPQTYPWVDPDQFARRPPGFSPALDVTSNHNEKLDKISEFLERMSKQPSN
jgi:hypothetical protein